MRPAIVAFAVGTAASAGVLAACFDLFHSTSDVLSACAFDAGTPGCFAPEAAVVTPPNPSPTDFCAWTPDQARAHARHACAWLGACETPMGGNAFGACMVQALLAYDCRANPNHRVKGKARAIWDCLWRANHCSDVESCILPEGPALCEPSTSYTACGVGSDAMAGNADVRFACADGGVLHPGAYGENCALWSRTCVSNGAEAFCGGRAGTACDEKKACLGDPRSQLEWCVDGGDIGIDCADNGGQFCVGLFPDAGHDWLACAVESDAGSCTPEPSASCANGVAFSCPTGAPETIDCASLLGADAGCQPGALAPPFDWTSPCAVVPPACTESCAGASLTGCARGAAFTLDCAAENLGPCRLVPTDLGAGVHAACAPP